MKKALLLVSILSISVFSTACINNFAVQELNNKAKVYLEQGDPQGAIERLKSSIDLDDTVFESHYNLAVAYTQAEDYPNAIASYQKAIQLKPDFADAYYSLAVAHESLAVAIDNREVNVSETGVVTPVDKFSADGADVSVKSELSAPASEMRQNQMTEAVNNYKKYVEIAPAAKDVEDVKVKITSLEEKINGAKK